VTAAAAAAAAAGSSAARTGEATGRIGRTVGASRSEDGNLDLGFFAGAFGARNGFVPVDDDFLKLGFAVVADVFVDGHRLFL
jgi:hypothetical protein